MDQRVKSCCAAFYEMPLILALLGNDVHPGGPALTRKLARAALVGRDSAVLDVACGCGESVRMLAQHLGCLAVGIDYSREHVARAKNLSEHAGLSHKVRFLQGDAEQLPFENACFDVVICECSLCLFPNLPKALQEIRRVLRPGGRLGMTDVVLNEAVPASLQDVFGRALCIGGALSIDGYQEALLSAGFSAIRCRNVSRSLHQMVARIERRAATMESLFAGEPIQLPEGMTLSRASVVEARNFVEAGGLGYALIVARTPRHSPAP